MTKTRREKKAKAIPEPVGYTAAAVSDDSKIIKKRAKEKRSCPWVVMDQVQLSTIGLVRHIKKGIDDTTVFTIVGITPNTGPVATWWIEVKHAQRGHGDKTIHDSLPNFQLYAKHNDVHRYIVA